ncbi:hypothetical protein [Actinacidiphila guanduensis]|uniref:hypothetical protein n=1 Tax=Actinacidiphila guanduensis TaxID=310781 RepID=UPI001FED0492
MLDVDAPQERLPAAVDVGFGGAGADHHSQTGLLTLSDGRYSTSRRMTVSSKTGSGPS